MKNKIGWCTMTFNPCWGCLNHCEYCYARRIAKRFWKQMWMIEANHHWKKHPTWAWTGDHLSGLKDFKPTFLESQFNKKFPKKPQRIFVGSMSEINYWEWNWMERVLNKIKQYPRHTFQFLTKFPQAYLNFYFPTNCWLGITIVEDIDKIEFQRFKISNPNNLKYVSFEPLIKNISLNLDGIDWVIIGAETGNRKGKVIPKRKWFEEIVYHRDMKRTPIYVKDNLTKYYPEYKGHKEFPNYK